MKTPLTMATLNYDILVTALHKIDLRKTFDMVYTRSNIQLADLNSKPHGGQSIGYIIDRAIGVHFYPPPGPEHYKLLRLDRFHGCTNHQSPSNDKNSRKMRWILSEYCDVYNMIHHYRAGRFSDENPTTIYIWLDYMRKDRMLVHLIPTVVYN